MAPESANVLQGTLDLLVLKSLSLARLHGLGVSRRIEQLTEGTFVVKPGSLVPELQRMEEAAWVRASWGVSYNNRRAKYYELTPSGRRQLETEVARWEQVSTAIALALQAG